MATIYEVTDSKRGCGYRKEGGYYMVLPEFKGHACGKLPFELVVCPCCGAGVKHTMGWTWINAKLLFAGVKCRLKDQVMPAQYSCVLDEPPEKMGLLWIGEQFYKTPDDWQQEAAKMGVSRRIKAVPKGFKLGMWVALAHIKAIVKWKMDAYGKPEIDDKGSPSVERFPGIFTVFQPTAIEYVVAEGDTLEELKSIEKRGIRLVKVKNLPEENKRKTPAPKAPAPEPTDHKQVEMWTI